MKLQIVAAVAISVTAPAPAQGPQLAPPLFSSLRWREIGPTSISGRVNDIAVARSPGQPDRIYVGFGGGIFKSANGGISWTPVFDHVNAMISVGDLAVAPSNPDIVWVGTGESVNPTLDWGDGVYKSTDGGKTWTSMGLRDSRHVGRVIVHPTNPDIVFVAAQGRMWGPNAERGVFKTADGGQTWRKVLYVDVNTGANDVQFDPANPMVLYASTYQRQRKGYGGILVGPGSGIYKSVDGGESWRKLTRGLPRVEMGRIGLEVSAADHMVILADIEVGGYVVPSSSGGTGGAAADCPLPGRGPGAQRNQFDSGEGGVYRSLDGGETWEQVNAGGDTPVGQFSQIRTDPRDRNRVYRLGTGFYVSDDLGRTYRTVNTGVHYEYHAMWVDPADPNHMLAGNDGGLVSTWDRGVTWHWHDNIPTTQFYEMSVDNRDPFQACGGTQDNGSWCVPSAVRNRTGISNADAYSVGGGDGMHFHADPFDSTFAVSDADRAQMRRVNLVARQQQSIKPGPGLIRPLSCLNPMADAPARPLVSASITGPGGRPFRWEWDTPLLFSSVTPGVVYTAANVLFRSEDRGGSWKAISPDLTARIDRDTISIMGKKVGALNYSPNGTLIDDPAVTSLYGAIIWIGESRFDPRILYTGSNDGQVQVTRIGGTTWTNVTPRIPALPPFTPVSTVLPSRLVAGRVYATFDGHLLDDDHPYVYVSEDYGQTWRSITSGLPMTPINRIAEHARDANLLVVGHRRGVHFSNDGGANWYSLSTNMPTVPTTSVVFQARDNALVAGTYGRGIWILDDVGPLQTLTPEGVKRDALLVSITRGRQWNFYTRAPSYGVEEYFAPNPEFDPVISYYARDGAASAAITIADSTGEIVRTLPAPATRGLNRVTWDMRMNPADPGPLRPGTGAGGGGAAGGGRAGAAAAAGAGPLVSPGTYRVTIAIAGIATPLTGEAVVQADPSDPLSAVDRRARQDAILQAWRIQRASAGVRATVRALEAQGDSIRRDLVSGGAARAAARADSLAWRVRRLGAESDRLVSISGALMRAMESFSSTPTADQRAQLAWAGEDLDAAVRGVNALIQSEIPALYREFAGGKQPRTPPPVPMPPARSTRP